MIGLRPAACPRYHGRHAIARAARGQTLLRALRHETKTGLRVGDLATGGDRWLLWPVQALAKVNNQLWVVAVPPYTGQAATVSVRAPSLPAKRPTDIGADYFA